MKQDEAKHEFEETKVEPVETIVEQETSDTLEASTVKESTEEKVETQEEVPSKTKEEVPSKTKEEVPSKTKEKAKPRKKKEKEKEPEEEEFVEERFYTIPLGKAWVRPPNKRAPRAMSLIKAFIMRHMKLGSRGEMDEAPPSIIITNGVNEKVWSRGIQKPPRRIRVKAARDKEGNVKVFLAEGE